MNSTGDDLVWYATYGSNMYAARFGCYLTGGTPPGAARSFPGARDPRPPRASRPLLVDGGIFFATESPVWGGGRAFYDPALPGTAAMRAYLITRAQFSDVAAQEMYRDPGADLDLIGVLTGGRAELGPGRYETLLRLPVPDDGHELAPVLTFTCPWTAGDQPLLAPSAAYLRMLAGGLRETHGWTPQQAGGYLATAPGAAGHWTAEGIAALDLH
ncbi:histone deacetylase [Amycolatopsis sp. 195334CR]|uniref:histone deacetylase n=1 Tax=Amycolatopsis sp. 195334CR TaxID=2814588 RepID=UPI001A8EE0F2|nr:histone deacetylase [Amycolatopsis sp. 195334CR]MBN6040020.1 histone deacetylase [Amycolatopsis sp. 195334CR]